MDSPDDEINKLMDDFKSVLSQTIHERDNRMHQENVQLRVQLREQNRRIEKLEAALQEYQTQTFDSIPTEELSDAAISEQYSVIREHISNWVECLPDVLEFERSFEQAMLEFHHLFNGNALSYWPDGVLEWPSVAQMELFSSTIFRILDSAVFDPYIMGAPRPHCVLFDNLERKMASLEVPKGEYQSFDAFNQLTAENVSRSDHVLENKYHQSIHITPTVCQFCEEPSHYVSLRSSQIILSIHF